MANPICSTCGGGYRPGQFHVHLNTAKHKRAATGPVSRKSSRANAGRARRAAARKQLTRKHEDAQWAHMERVERRERREAQGPRHWYGAWFPYGVSAFMGGRPGRGPKKRKKKRRR